MNRSVQRNIFSAVLLMASASIGPLFLMSTASNTIEFGATFAFVIVITALIELGIQMNIWRILSVVKQPANVAINEINSKIGFIISILVLLGSIAFNIINIAGLGIGISLIFNIDVKIAASIGIVISVLLYMLNKNRVSLTACLGILFSFIVMIIILGFIFASFSIPYDIVLARTIIPEFRPGVLLSVATLISVSIGGYISFSGVHRLIDTGVTGEKHVKQVTRGAFVSVLIVTAIRFLLFLVVFGLTNNNVILFEDNILEGVFLELFGDAGLIALGILFIAASITSIIGATYTTGTFLKPLNSVIHTNIDVVMVMIVITSWLIYLISGQDKVLITVTSILNGLILPIIFGGLLHATKRRTLVGTYKHPMWLFIYGAVSLILLFGFVFVSIYAQIN